MLRDNCARHADALAVVDGATALTYGELWQYSDDWLALLAARDVGPGVRVCIWSHNSWQWIVAATAVWRLGATLVPISSRLKALDARAIIDKSRARVLLATADCGGTDLPGLLLAEFGAGEDHPVAGLPTLASIGRWPHTRKSLHRWSRSNQTSIVVGSRPLVWCSNPRARWCGQGTTSKASRKPVAPRRTCV